MYSLAHLLPLGQRKHIIELYFRPLTLKRFIVIGCKQDRLIPMGTRVTPKPLASVGKVVGFNFLTMTCVYGSLVKSIQLYTKSWLEIRNCTTTGLHLFITFELFFEHIFISIHFFLRCPKNRVFGTPGFWLQTGPRTG